MTKPAFRLTKICESRFNLQISTENIAEETDNTRFE